MAAVGGSIESITLAGRNFAVTADAESQRKLGGFEGDVQVNGDGTARFIKTRVAFMIEGITVEIDDDRGDQEYLQELSNRNDYFPIVISYPSGNDYQGSAQIVGETTASSQNASASISLSGPGVLTKQ